MERPADLDLSPEALQNDLQGAQRALGVSLTLTEEKEALPNARLVVHRTLRVELGSGAPAIHARFVQQGWAQLAKKLFVKEVEIGEAAFDDAVYIATDTPNPVRVLLGHDRVREALVALVGREAIVDLSPTELTVEQMDAYGDGAIESAEVLAIAAHLRG